jgi:uncharacterized protein YgiM (DUF1202 family)
MLLFTRICYFNITLLLVILLNSCVNHNKIDSFYSILTISYLRETPSYDSRVVTELYYADKVKLIAKSDNGWWQVESLRDQQVGWTKRDLLTETPIIAKIYYIIDSGVLLRHAPQQDVISRKWLYYGDKVSKIAENDGWWRVLVEKDKSIGWIPAKTVSENPFDSPGGEKPKILESDKAGNDSLAIQPASKVVYYFVAAGSLNLYIIPSIPSSVVKVLKLNDKVEQISQSGRDWLKVRYLDTGAEGWALSRDLRSSPVTDKAQVVTPKKKSQKKGTLPKKWRTLEPEGM